MKKNLITASVFLLMGGVAYSQVGVNTENPMATMDVVATKTDNTTAEGIIAPRLKRSEVIAKDAKYTTDQTGTIVYVTDVSGTTTTKTAKIDKIGYYYFDGALWQPFTAAAAAAASNPWYKVGTTTPSTLNTDNSYLRAQAVIGGTTPGDINGGIANAQLTVSGDAKINLLTVGLGAGNKNTNTAVGWNALATSGSGAHNTAVGLNALKANTDGGANTALGRSALEVVTTGSNNTAVGYFAGGQLTSGSGNTAVGRSALATAKGTTGNTVMGYYAGNLIEGSYNTAIGYSSLPNLGAGEGNTALGYVSGFALKKGDFNTAIGRASLQKLENGEGNTALGHLAAPNMASGDFNTAIGRASLQGLLSGFANTALGYMAGVSMTSGSRNILIGYSVNPPNLAGDNQINIGNALYGTVGDTIVGAISIGKKVPDAGVRLDVYGVNQVTGTFRYVNGKPAAGSVLVSKDDAGNAVWQTSAALAAAINPWNKVGTTTPSTLNTDNSYLTAQAVIGGATPASINGGTANAQLTVTGADASINGITVGKGKGNIGSNTAVGVLSLNANISGAENTSVGSNALFVNTTGTQNTAVGSVALIVSNGSQNTAVGRWALTANTSGNGNTGVGMHALGRNNPGNNNTALGNSAGNLLTAGDNNIMIGANTQVPVVTGSNQLNIGNALYGTVGATAATGSVSIGKTAPAAGTILDVNGVMRYTDGNQASGKVLTSDANGNASWQIPGALPATPVAKFGAGINLDPLLAANTTNFSYAGATLSIPSAGKWIIMTSILLYTQTVISDVADFQSRAWVRSTFSSSSTAIETTGFTYQGTTLVSGNATPTGFSTMSGYVIIQTTGPVTLYYHVGNVTVSGTWKTGRNLVSIAGSQWAENSIVAFALQN